MWIHKNNHMMVLYVSQHCIYKDILGEENKCCFPSTLEQRTKKDAEFHKFMDDEADRMKGDVQEQLLLHAVVVSQIEVGGIDAIPTADACADGHYFVEFTSKPYESMT